MLAGSPLRVSVALPTYGGAAWIERALDSLASQTLDPSVFEVVVVVNGPDDGTAALVRRFAAAHPRLRLRLLVTEHGGYARAVNLAVASAAGEYVTMLDDDDHVSPSYLAALLAHAAPDAVVVGHLADVPESGGPPDFDTYVNRALSRVTSGRTHPDHARGALSFNTAKLVRTDLARDRPMREDLRLSPDIVFWHHLVNAHRLELHTVEAAEHAVYFRTVRPGSHSRPVEDTWETAVLARLDAIEALLPIASDPRQYLRSVSRSACRSQARAAATYLRGHPDEHARLLAELERRGIGEGLWESFNRRRARDLVVAYVFLPSNDTSALVAARRIRVRDVAVDVISHDLSDRRDQDPTATHELLRRHLGDHRVVRGKVTFDKWTHTARFAREGLSTIEDWERERGPYRSLYSRSMWPPSHVLGAAHKVRSPDCHWRAEFSDPLSRDVLGRLRGGAQGDDDLSRALDAALVAAGHPADPGWTLAQWIEHLPLVLADEVLFTNENQRDHLLEHVADPVLRERVRRHSVVEHHPTPSAELYSASDVDHPLAPDAVNIGFFGAFYATRGLTEVVAAVGRLDDEQRRRLRLHVFTADPETLAAEVEATPALRGVVSAHPYVPYLDFLRLTTLFDCLLVNDYRTAGIHTINPYLPSKVSDYLGSGTPLWAVVEPGSVLSTLPVAFRSELGDVEGARRVLTELVEQHAAQPVG